MRPTICILTFNSVDSVGQTIAAARHVSNDILVVDSGSTDGTLELLSTLSVRVLQHPFESYGAQRNWAIALLNTEADWQLHLDADEIMSPALIQEVVSLPNNPEADGYVIPRYLRFMGKILKHNLAPTFHMRLFRTGYGLCETRLYDQHFICSGSTAELHGEMVDDIRMSLSEWTRRHNNWSDAEVEELSQSSVDGRLQGNLGGNAIERRRAMKSWYLRSPLFLRSVALFFYRYIFLGGFLDGTEGFIFCVLQAFWFRFLVDAKLYERKLNAATKAA